MNRTRKVTHQDQSNIKFQKIRVVQKGRPEKGVFVPLVNALTHPKVDARHQSVTVPAALGIYEKTRDTLRGQKYRKHGGGLIATVTTGFRYLKAEDGVEFLFLEKKEVQKMVKDLKAKPNLPWPLWIVFAKSKKDLPGNLSELEKPDTPVLPEEVPRGLIEFSNPNKSNPQEFERHYLAWVKLFKKGLLEDPRLQENYNSLEQVEETWESKRNRAKREMGSTTDETAYDIWEDRFHEAKFFLKRIGRIRELAKAKIWPGLEQSSGVQKPGRGPDAATSGSVANYTNAGNKPGRPATAQRRKAIVRKHFKTKKDLDKSISDGRLLTLLKELDDDKDVPMPAPKKFRGFKLYCEIYDAAQADSSGNAELILIELVDLLKRDLYE